MNKLCSWIVLLFPLIIIPCTANVSRIWSGTKLLSGLHLNEIQRFISGVQSSVWSIIDPKKQKSLTHSISSPLKVILIAPVRTVQLLASLYTLTKNVFGCDIYVTYVCLVMPKIIQSRKPMNIDRRIPVSAEQLPLRGMATLIDNTLQVL